MKVLVIGSGSREHVLAWKIAQSSLLTKLYAAPGNPGIAAIAECHPIEVSNIQGLLQFAQKNGIDLTVVGPEAPLAAGIVDDFQNAGLKIVGPVKTAAQLEGSKSFAKDRMVRFGIPTADYEVFSNINEAKHYCVETDMPVVIKADGLAQGKGVIICQTSQEAVAALTQIMSDAVFGDAGKKVVIERLLEGEEVSILALSDGDKIIPLVSAQDHKRAYDHDKGPNTGGMGAYSPCPFVTDDKLRDIVDVTIRPMIQGLAREGNPYRGIIYAGLMMTKNGPYVLEYNCRFGDPETQAILPRLKSDLLKVFVEMANGKLQTSSLEWHDKTCVAVVMASGGYPGFYHKGFPINGLESVNRQEDAWVFHAGTALDAEGRVVTAGGRVLTLAALGDNLRSAREKVYSLAGHVQFEGGFYRRDIGGRALEVLR